MKAEVLAVIGEDGLRRPAAVNAALAANDRVKYAFTLLQTAAAHADQPEQQTASLKRERIACGIEDAALDLMVASACRQGGRYQLPGAQRLLARVAAEMRVMAAPVLETGKTAYADRLESLLGGMPEAADDLLDRVAIAAMTRAADDGTDSLHRLVMDLHKELNALQTALAEESVDGAAAYALAPEDRPRVAAFMAGLNRTARLKFDHPGLATIATRDSGRLVIQNDIGTTDAHVVVVHVQDLTVSVTYTDVHADRLRFFQTMLDRFKPDWTATQAGQLGGGSQFSLATARFTAADEAGCRAYLAFLGSRLVFLIDWNRARKQLRTFLPGPARLSLLRWAAEQEVGHRGFLELGGAALVNQAIEASAGSNMHFGDVLSDVLGVAEAEAFLRFTFRAATDSLIAHSSPTLLRDRLRAELARHFSNEARRLLRVAAEHAGLLLELACLVRDGVLALPDGPAPAIKLANRARRFEHDADRLVADTFDLVRRRPDYAHFGPLLHAADDAADALEDAAYLLSLLAAGGPDGKATAPLQTLAGVIVEASQEWVKALLDAAHVHDHSAAEDADDFLIAIDRIAVLEHQADDTERALTASAVRHAADFRQLHLYSAIGERLEQSADAFKRASVLLRDHVLSGVLGG